MLLPFQYRAQVQPLEKAWGLNSHEAFERRAQAIFRRYFERLQRIPEGEEGNLARAVPWNDAAEQLAEEWEALVSKVIVEAGKDGTNPDFLLDNPYTKAWIQTHWTDLVTEMERTSKDALHQVIAAGVQGNRTVQQVSRDIRPLVGLRSDQMDAVQRQFVWLQQNHPKLGIKGLSAEKAAERAMAYGRKLLNQRVMLIARTEIMTASNAGLIQSWQDASSKGLILPQARRHWIVNAGALRTCERCRAFAGATATLTGNFISKTGEVAHAPPLHPACRCSQALRTRVLKPGEK